MTTAAADGARLVAGSQADPADARPDEQARAEAEARVRADLGSFGRRVRIDWTGTNADLVQVRVQGDAPRFLFPGLQHDLGTDHIDRAVRVRVEAWR